MGSTHARRIVAIVLVGFGGLLALTGIGQLAKGQWVQLILIPIWLLTAHAGYRLWRSAKPRQSGLASQRTAPPARGVDPAAQSQPVAAAPTPTAGAPTSESVTGDDWAAEPQPINGDAVAPPPVAPTAAQPSAAARVIAFPGRWSRKQPATTPTEPWAKPEWPAIDVAGAFYYKDNAIKAMKQAGYGRLNEGQNDLEVTAELECDPTNEFDSNAVKVLMVGQQVGHLPRDIAAEYFPALDDLFDDGKHLAVPGRLRVYRREDWEKPGEIVTHCYPTVKLPPVAGVQAFNTFPDEPYTVLPRGRTTIQVTEEEDHMDLLRKYLGHGNRYVAVTLQAIERQKTPRSQVAQLVEVRLDGEPVGVLTKAMSAQLIDLVRFVGGRGRVPVARGCIAGSPLRVEVTLDVAKSSEVSRDWMDRV